MLSDTVAVLADISGKFFNLHAVYAACAFVGTDFLYSSFMLLLSGIFSNNSDILCELHSSPLPDLSYVHAFPALIRFATSACQILTGTYIRSHCYIVQTFGRCFHLSTMASADFSQFVVTTANETAREISRDKSVFFPRLPS